MANQEIAKLPWKGAIEEAKSELSTMVELGPKMFTSRQKVLLEIANTLKISDTGVPSFLQMPLVNGEKEIVAAVVLQNLLHPKNHHRREAVEQHSYVAITNLE